jgi:hypothetical protein
MAINSEFNSGAVLTASQQNRLPFGIVSITTLASNFDTASVTATNITGLSVTFTAVANRRYLIVLQTNAANTGNNITQTYISKAGTALSESYSGPIGANNVETEIIFAMDTPGAGSVTYQAQASVSAGTSTIYGTSTRASIASRLLVLDVGTA